MYIFIKILIMKVLSDALNGSKTVVFFDFEGTQFSQEIIAIGAIKVDLDNKLQVVKKYNPFKIYVISKEKVGNIVTTLTGLTDEFLHDNGVLFNEAIDEFKKYIGNVNKDIKFLSYGNFDMRLLHQSATLNNYNDDPLIRKIYSNYVDFSTIFSRYVKSYKGETLSLVDALKILKITPKENIHDPETDAINLMYLYKGFLNNKKILKEEYIKILKRYNHFPNPVNKTMSKLFKEGSVSYEDFLKFVEEDL